MLSDLHRPSLSFSCPGTRARRGLAALTVGMGLCLVPLLSIADTARSTPARATASAPTAPATTTAVAATPAAAATTSSSAPAAPSNGASNDSQPKVVCFKTSIRCFATTKRARQSPASSAANLDLRAPEINHVFSQQELQEKLPEEQEQDEIHEEVQVEGERQLAPVSVGIMALPWAVLHPTQAWRIFMPLPAAQTK